MDGAWRGVCDHQWDYEDAFVACRQLGYPATGTKVYVCNEHYLYNCIISTEYLLDSYGINHLAVSWMVAEVVWEMS